MQYVSAVKDGKLSGGVAKSIRTALESLEGRVATITIQERKKRRSLKQNAFYWGCILPPITVMFREWGNNVDCEQVHEFLKAEVGKLNQPLILPDGEVKQVTSSSSNLETMEFEEYLTKVRAWASEWGVMLPLPNEYDFNNKE